MSTQIINAAIAASIVSGNTANTVGGNPTFYGCPVVDGLGGGTSRRYEGLRFVRVHGVEINALQGAYIVTGSGVESRGEETLEVRVAEVRLVRTSRTGRTSWPALVEEGWVPGFRADQIPSPAALRGLNRFVVFPAGSTGHSDWQAEVVEVAEWTEAVAAWEAWRQQEGSLPASTEGTWRLARNHTRSRLGWWTTQEVKDLLCYASDAVMEDHGCEGILFFSEQRGVCGWAPSRTLDQESGEVASVWPLGLRQMGEGFSSDGMAVECLQVIDNELHWKFVSSTGTGIYVNCHAYFVWNGSPRPPFSDKEWTGKIEKVMVDAKKEYDKRTEWWDNALPITLVPTEDAVQLDGDDEEY